LSSWVKKKQRRFKILQVVCMREIELNLLCNEVDVDKEYGLKIFLVMKKIFLFSCVVER